MMIKKTPTNALCRDGFLLNILTSIKVSKSYQIQGSHAGCKGDSCAIDMYKMAAQQVEHRRRAWNDYWNVHLAQAARACLALLGKRTRIFLFYFFLKK